ncbi:ATP-binding protein [Desulfovibrio mangrovi]|uniref:ATP-binding protein n=1 Tax=Desulfovibrio mangrovi TaxID=2976983 RepID=UPI0022453CD8|nr:ATP-binding protein [Desulfovibrio mangrovi]UZP67242.1 ATP-binding protein [Desulfovibrio mangrovi]
MIQAMSKHGRGHSSSGLFAVMLTLLLAVVILAGDNVYRVYKREQDIRVSRAQELVNNLLEQTNAFYERYDTTFRALALTVPFSHHQTEPANHLARRLLEANPELVNVAATDKTGVFFASAIPFKQSGASISNLDFFKRIAAGAPKVVMNPHLGPLSKHLVTGMIVPLHTEEGEFNGVIGASILFSSLTKQWDRYIAGKDISLLVWDHAMVIRHGSDDKKGLIGEPLADDTTLSAVLPLDKRQAQSVLFSESGRRYRAVTGFSEISNLQFAVILEHDIPLMHVFEKTPYLWVLLATIGMLAVSSVVVYVRERDWQANLLVSERQYQNLLDAIPATLVGINADGVVTHWNRAAEAMTGVSAVRALGADVRSLILRPQMEPLLQQVLNKEEVAESLNVKVMTEDGIRYENIRCYPVVAGKMFGALLRIDDVTEQVRFNEVMIQTEKMMSVGGLAAGMAHEINNPLGIIMQSTQNVFRRVSSEMKANQQVAEELGVDLTSVGRYLEARGVMGFLRNIREATGRGSKIVSNMLQFSRQSSGQKQPCDMNQLLDGALALAQGEYSMRKKYDFKRVRIIKDYAENLPKVECAATEIEQVVLNILKNAAQAMAEHCEKDCQPEIGLQTRLVDGDVRIDIWDNGPGMEQSVQDNIFKPFFSTKPVGSGTGLGLSVSHFIITQNHKGTLGVDSELGKGSRFIIHLPLVAENNRSAANGIGVPNEE